MRKIRGLLAAAAVTVIVLTGAEAIAVPTVTFLNTGGTTGGGAFNVQTSADGNFLTFCLEYAEHISLGTTYYYGVSQSAKYNGAAPITGTMDPISQATAWLFLQFATGNLAGYNQSSQHQDDLQRAFWYLEGETGGVYNSYVNLSISHFANLSEAMSDNNGTFNVGVMNVWSNANMTGPAQDQLILLPSRVPDGGATVGLLGLSLVVTACFARRNLKGNSLANCP
jgi:hypothetical protein